MKQKQVIIVLEDALKSSQHLIDACDGKGNNCSVFDASSIKSEKMIYNFSNAGKEGLPEMSDIDAIKRSIKSYTESWILPNIRKALNEITREPESKRRKREEDREQMGRIMEVHRKEKGIPIY